MTMAPPPALPRRRHLLSLAAATAAAGGLPWRPAVAQGGPPAGTGWVPDRTITMITGYAPGGSTDIAARLIADRMAATLGPNARIVVENRPGAAGVVATEWLKRQAPDGSVIMVTETGSAVAAPAAIVGGTKYDPIEDFTQIGVISTPPTVLVVAPDFPGGKDPAAILAAMREGKPESITYASSGFGGVLHLRSEMLAQVLGTRFVHVPYRSGAQMVTAIMTGEAQFGIAAMASATPFLRDGKVRGVALVGTRRFPTFPDIPTLSEIGVPGFENSGFFMLIGPAGMPRPVTEALNRALNAALRDPGIREKMILAGHDPVQSNNTPEETRAYLVGEWAEMRQLVARTGVRIQP
jgi:tripartite-type tricarboxylate transporter receptor subunit TctC